MKQSGSDDAESLVIVAHAVKTRGLKGELVAELLTDFPERFKEIRSLIAVSPLGKRERVRLETFWFHQGRVILKLGQVDSIEAAKQFVGCDFAVPEAERVPLPEGSFYDWELEGCSVLNRNGEQVGKVSEVMRLGGEIETLAVANAEGKTMVIPVVEGIVKEIDLVNRKIHIDPPEGLLEL